MYFEANIACIADVLCTALEQTHSALKHHAVALEAALAERASSEMESDSAARDELGRRDQQAVELIERVEQLEEILNKERQGTKDLRAQVCSLCHFCT